MTTIKNSKIDFLNKEVDASIVKVGSYTTSQRDAISASAGMIIRNSDLNAYEGYNGLNWTNLGSGGSGSFSPFTAAVNGSQYTTVAAAVADGHKSILVTIDATETENVVMTSDLYIYIVQGVTWNLSTYSIDLGSPTEDRTLSTEIEDGGRWEYDGVSNVFINHTENSHWTHKGGDIVQTNIGQIYHAGVTTISNCNFYLHNSDLSMLTIATSDSSMSNVVFVGGGTDSGHALRTNGGTYSNICFIGTWKSGTQLFSCDLRSSYCGVTTDIDTPHSIKIKGNMSNLVARGTAYPSIGFDEEYSKLSDFYASDLTFYHNKCQATNGVVQNVTALETNYSYFANIGFEGVTTVTGNENKLMGCNFGVSLHISSSSYNTIIIGCTANSYTNSGTGTIKAGNQAPIT